MGQQGRRTENRLGIPELFEKGATQSAMNIIREKTKDYGCRSTPRNFSFPHFSLTNNSSQSGFTLLEIVIAMGIFGITLVSSIAAVSQMHLLQETGRNLSVASFHAQKVIEQVRLKADTSIATASGINWTTWAGSNGCNVLANETVSVSFTPVTSNLTEVMVNVAWNTKDHPMTYQVVTRLVN